jgi:hypothetical protein
MMAAAFVAIKNEIDPKRSNCPARTSLDSIGCSSTNVPLRLFKSRTANVGPTTESSAWHRETERCGITKSQVGARPTVVFFDAKVMTDADRFSIRSCMKRITPSIPILARTDVTHSALWGRPNQQILYAIGSEAGGNLACLGHCVGLPPNDNESRHVAESYGFLPIPG